MPRTVVPIMSRDEERYMAFEGLVQWTQAVISQAARVKTAKKDLELLASLGPKERHRKILASHSEDHFFIIAANKVFEYREWAASLGLCAMVDFGDIDVFPRSDIKDLRNMREHIVEYFKGCGKAADRWVVETPEFKADASSVMGNLIGGRLDYAAFTIAAEKLLPQLLAQPIPYPPRR